MIHGIIASKLRAALSASVGDPFYDQVVCNMHFDAADGSTSMVDQKGHTFTRQGAAQIDTAQSVFGGSSLLLDGTDDYVTSPDHADWALGSSNWTVDCWVRFNGDPGTGLMSFVSHYEANVGANRGWVVGLNNNTLRLLYSTNGTSTTILSTAWNPASATWYYISVVRYGATIYFFVDGTLLGTASIGTDSIFDAVSTLQIGTQSNGADGDFNGWIDDVRITRAARYTTSFSRPHKAHYDNLGTPGDELWDRVVSSLHFNNNLTDVKGISWTAAGNAAASSAQSKFGGFALALDGSGDWLDASHASLAAGTGDFTQEAWVRYSSRSGNNFIWSFGGGWGVYTFGGTWAVFDGASTNVIMGGTVADNTWYHVALSRRGSTMYLHVDGAVIGSTSNSTNFSNTAIRIGAQPSGSGTMTGWVDDFRMTTAARYVGVSQFPVLQNPDRLGDPNFDYVNALVHFNTDFSDVKGHTFTPNGSAAISTAQFKYGPASVRGPGSGSYVHAATHADFGIGLSDYTIEFWFRYDSVSGTQCVFDMRPFGSGGAGPMMTLVGSRVDVFLNSGYRVQTGTVVAATWHHFVITRRSTTTKVFFDGTQLGSDYTDTNNYPSTQPFVFFRFSDSGSFPGIGYIDEYRFTRGVSRYLTNFSPLPVPHPDTF